MDKVGTSANTILLSKYRSKNPIKGSALSSSRLIRRNSKGEILPDYNLKLSAEAKKLQNQKPTTVNPTKVKPSIEDSSPMHIPDMDVPDIVDIPKAPDVPDTPDIEDFFEEGTEAIEDVEKANDLKKATEVIKKEPTTIKKPAVFFVGGFQMMGGGFFGDGLKDMAEAVKEARYYEWDQKGEMIEQIKKRPHNQKVILVGQGLGGDTAVEIAQELNSLKNEFRKIDLLVTLNSVGFDNDFIPQNVAKNLNFLTADNGLTDDGPNIAINDKRTQVKNILRQESHSELDDSTDVQVEIMDEIKNLLS